MFPVVRALLIINRSAGTGQRQSFVDQLTLLFRQGLAELSQVEIESVNDHSTARDRTTRFISESDGPALVVAGGGGGTLRATIEGICDSRVSNELPGSQRVRVGALRMGSGNVLAKQFGVPRDPIAGLSGLLENLKAEVTVPCCVMQCETWASTGDRETHHAVTLGGLGQFGRIPLDLARWHARFPLVHKTAARWCGIERLTNIEYAIALLIRSISCVFVRDCAETIAVQTKDHVERFQLLSGLMMNFPMGALPFKPGVTVRDEAAELYLIPLEGRFAPLLQIFAPQRLTKTRRIRLDRNNDVQIEVLDRDRIEFFLDEDPVTTHKRLRLGVAGSIAFVPGPDYREVASRGVYA
jgi:diacylglycerol kinase family enzyme